MSLGYLLIRETDSIRYEIFMDNLGPFITYKDKIIRINHQLNKEENNLIILDENRDYNNFINNANNGFPIININGKLINNNNIISINL